jgi:hypothetical protein
MPSAEHDLKYRLAWDSMPLAHGHGGRDASMALGAGVGSRICR